MLWWFGGGGGVKVLNLLISIVKESRETDRDSQPEGEKKKGAYERDAIDQKKTKTRCHVERKDRVHRFIRNN